jgi:hypothetical protein
MKQLDTSRSPTLLNLDQLVFKWSPFTCFDTFDIELIGSQTHANVGPSNCDLGGRTEPNHFLPSRKIPYPTHLPDAPTIQASSQYIDYCLTTT